MKINKFKTIFNNIKNPIHPKIKKDISLTNLAKFKNNNNIKGQADHHQEWVKENQM